MPRPRCASSTPATRHEVREALAAIAGDARRAGEIVLRAHRLVRKQPVAAEPVDIARTAAEVLEFTRTRMRHAGITARLEAARRLPVVMADPIQIYQALLNLVVNAIEAMEGEAAGNRAASRHRGRTGRRRRARAA